MYPEIKSTLVRDLLINQHRDLGVMTSNDELDMVHNREKDLRQALNLKSYRKLLDLPHRWEETADWEMQQNDKFQRAIRKLKPLTVNSTMSFLYRYLNPRRKEWGDDLERWELRELETKALAVLTVWDLEGANDVADNLHYYLQCFIEEMQDAVKHCYRIDKMFESRATVDMLLRALEDVHANYHYANVK